MPSQPNYIIYSPAYDENCGGVIVLHKLCDMLNSLGEKAYFWPPKKSKQLLPPLNRNGLRSLWNRKEYAVCRDYNTPIASRKHLRNSIVVYPEVISGNPLAAKNTVRWFLHKPGFHTGVINYGDNELYFLFEKFCDDPVVNTTPGNELTIYTLNPAYKNMNRGQRSGSCFMMRKGKGKTIAHDMNDSVQIDGLSHSEIADIFNKKETFYCYDEETMYSLFAVLCGCTSVVMPSTYKGREEWVAHHPIAKYGVAYGLDDIEHAKKTQHLVREYFDEREQQSILAVKQFITKTYDFFGFEHCKEGLQ